MNKKLIKLGFTVFILTVFFVGFNSCSSDNETDFNNESSVIEEDVFSLAKGYASIYEDILKTVVHESKEISRQNLDLEDHFKNFTESYINGLAPNQSKLLNRVNLQNTRNGEQSQKTITVPDDLMDKIRPLLFVDDFGLLIDEINEFYNSQYFLNLDQKDQKELKIQLETLKITRNCVAEFIIDHFQNEEENITTRSPGDRMIMSESCAQMTDEQRERCVNLAIAGMGLVASGAGGVVLAVVSAVLAFF